MTPFEKFMMAGGITGIGPVDFVLTILMVFGMLGFVVVLWGTLLGGADGKNGGLGIVVAVVGFVLLVLFSI